MQYTEGPIGVIVESAASFYATVVWGSADGTVDLPAASGAGNIAGVLLPKANASSYSANDSANLAIEPGRIVKFNKVAGYTVTRGDYLAIFNTDGALAPVSHWSAASGTNLDIIGKATESCASDDTVGYMMITHGSYQEE